jgi:hypothetical protein
MQKHGPVLGVPTDAIDALPIIGHSERHFGDLLGRPPAIPTVAMAPHTM